MTINIKAHIRGMKIYNQFIKHELLFHIVCFSAQINDFHLIYLLVDYYQN